NNVGKIVLRLQEIHFAYQKASPVFEGLNLQVRRGERLGIIGPNGAGKSTLLLLLNGLLKPEKGRVEVLGEAISPESEMKVRQTVGLVFQNPEDQLFCPTVFDDVAFGPLNFGLSKEQVTARVRQALNEVGLSYFEERSTFNLSFGEKKLVALATALSMQPEIVALDEPTSNLDAIHRRKIMRWVSQNGRTCLITSHDLDMIYDTCQRTIILNHGQIVADGPSKQILKNEELLKANDLELPLRFQPIK
ncbi:MAG: energy-coupling factor ABC transporter ATP-binding protein, partial [Caldisericaceae bacterium]|nr:energy-coupling factor ABC transporter ATP-binding protein [Caldisericaceae bacterium]